MGSFNKKLDFLKIRAKTPFSTRRTWVQMPPFALKIGYARVSTLEQNPDLQHDALKKAGCKKIYTYNASWVKTERPALNEILEYIRNGDSPVVWRLDQLGRSLKHLIEVVEDLENRKVGFMSLQGINTTTAGGLGIPSVWGALRI